MNPSERQRSTVDYLDSVGVCSYQDLARMLNVSEMTIRRDIDKLAQKGKVIKTLGGVQTARASRRLYESPVQERLPIQRVEKEQIAREAMRQIKPHQTIFLDGGSTCLILARHLSAKLKGLTIVTHSALACMEFGQTSGNAVFCLGGQFDPTSACFTGPTTEEAARRFFVDVAFFTTKGFRPEEGTFESSIATFRIKQIVAEQAARVVLLVDHSKFGAQALCKVLDIGQIHEVITDAGTTEDNLSSLAERNVVVRVESEGRLPLEVVSDVS